MEEAGGGTPTDEGEPTPEAGPAPVTPGGTVEKTVWPGTEQEYQAYLGTIKVEIDENLGKARVQIARALDSAFVAMAPLTDRISSNAELSLEFDQAIQDKFATIARRGLNSGTVTVIDGEMGQLYGDLQTLPKPVGGSAGAGLPPAITKALGDASDVISGQVLDPGTVAVMVVATSALFKRLVSPVTVRSSTIR